MAGDRPILDTTPRQEAATAFYPARSYEEARRETIRGHEAVWLEGALEDSIER